MKIILPWPPSAASPNARVHWSKRAKAVKQYRQECMVLTRNAGVVIDWPGFIHLFVTFYAPDRRRRDDDNCFSCFKGGRDGIADALGIDDNRIRMHPYLSDEIRRGGEVEVRLVKHEYGVDN